MGPWPPREKGLSKRWVAEGAERSLARLGVEAIDVYFSHQPDPDTPYEETLAAHDALIKAGKVKAIGASNHNASQLEAALAASQAHGLPRYEVVQPEYNLYDRSSYEGPLRDLSIKHGLGVVTYFSRASGFLTGKYRSHEDLGGAARSGLVAKYLDARGHAILQTIEGVAKNHGVQLAEVSLAWLMSRDGVTAPIASATSVAQVASFAKAAALKLSRDELEVLESAGDQVS